MTYRADIDGLRALAVAVVILFHAGLDSLSGGFLGVDIFFVISGYLITNIIVAEVNRTQKFDYWRFYSRRMRRLIPTLLTVIAGSTVGAMIFLPPDLVSNFGGSIIHSVLSLSNIYFWMSSGYFDPSGEVRPLLHTWSLSVEEQFYMFWPMTLVGLTLIAGRLKLVVPAVLIILGAASFVAGEYVLSGGAAEGVFSDPESAVFYLTPFRVFEFVVGGLLVWVPSLNNRWTLIRSVLSLVGLSLIVFSLFTVTEESRFPSYNALIPAVGTALLIYSQAGTFVGKAFSIKPIVYIGTISYTLYLVHWPVIVFYKSWLAAPLSYADMAAVIGITGVISVIVYHAVEKPLRKPGSNRPSLSKGSFAFACAGGGLLLSLPGTLLYAGGSANNQVDLMDLEPIEINAQIDRKSLSDSDFALAATWPLDPNVVKAAAAELIYPYRCAISLESKDYKDQNGNWVCNSNASVQILSVGNSHERHAYTLLRNLYEHEFNIGSANIEFASTHSIFVDGAIERCRPAPDERGVLTTSNPECAWLFERVGDPVEVARKYNVLLVGALRPLDYGDEYMQFARAAQLENPELKVIVTGSVVDIEPLRCIDLANKAKTAQGCLDDRFVRYYNPNEEAELRVKWPDLDFYYIDQRRLLCGNGPFSGCDIDVNGIPIFFDGHHFTTLAIPKFMQAAERVELKADLGSYLFD